MGAPERARTLRICCVDVWRLKRAPNVDGTPQTIRFWRRHRWARPEAAGRLLGRCRGRSPSATDGLRLEGGALQGQSPPHQPPGLQKTGNAQRGVDGDGPRRTSGRPGPPTADGTAVGPMSRPQLRHRVCRETAAAPRKRGDTSAPLFSKCLPGSGRRRDPARQASGTLGDEAPI